MAIDRRTFTCSVAALALDAARSGHAATSREQSFAANIREPDGSFAAVAYSMERGLLRKARLPDRGHDLTYSRHAGLLVAFARRPGNFAVAFNPERRSLPVRFTTPPDRHFFGHGVFSPDGRLLYATENDFERGVGVIGIYDVGAGFRRIGEHASFGIGPHDLNILGDGRTLVVANGGIATHPVTGRQPLNLATMRSSLAYIDSRTGALLERHETTDRRQKLSIRHLDVGSEDRVVFGCQFKGPRSQWMELVGVHRRGEELVFLPIEPTVGRALRHYVSSVAVDRHGEIAGITSSRGQQIVFVDIRRMAVIAVQGFRDVSGIAAHVSGGFVLTGGYGDVGVAEGRAPVSLARHEDWSWDNHAIALET